MSLSAPLSSLRGLIQDGWSSVYDSFLLKKTRKNEGVTLGNRRRYVTHWCVLHTSKHIYELANFHISHMWHCKLQFHSSLHCLFPSRALCIWNVNVLGHVEAAMMTTPWLTEWLHIGQVMTTTPNRKLLLFQNKKQPCNTFFQGKVHFCKVRYT